VVQLMSSDSGAILREERMADVCGIARLGTAFAATTGNGQFLHLTEHVSEPLQRTDLAWDNHLIALG
jgi:hypothetical protein